MHDCRAWGKASLNARNEKKCCISFFVAALTLPYLGGSWTRIHLIFYLTLPSLRTKQRYSEDQYVLYAKDIGGGGDG